jgi:hypothetical protein
VWTFNSLNEREAIVAGIERLHRSNHEHRKAVLEKLLKLTPDKQKEVLDFVETLEKNAGATRHRRSLKGLWADLGVEVSSEDIAETRREMWGGFPRENV